MNGKKVLVIDDDPDALGMVRSVLSKAGADVHSSATAEEGLYHFHLCHPDLVILGISVSSVAGKELCRFLRERADVPVICLIGLEGEGDVLRSLDCGAVDYLIKPFSPKVLLERARAALWYTALGFAPTTQSDSTSTVDPRTDL
jgi:DNA-binding response OmpR family regulator